MRKGLALSRSAVVIVITFLIIGAAACSQGKASQTTHSTTKTSPAAPATSVAFSWSAPQPIDSNAGGLDSVSCPSANFCAAVGGTGPGVVGSVIMWNGTSWSAPHVLSQSELNHVSCPSANFCLTGAPDGTAFVWNGTSWSATPQIRWPNPNDGIIGVSCASASFCVAPDEDGDMRVWNGTSWSVEYKEGAHSVSCPTPTYCIGVTNNGAAVAWNCTSFSAPQTIDGTGGSSRLGNHSDSA